jgi:hypothetical protein
VDYRFKNPISQVILSGLALALCVVECNPSHFEQNLKPILPGLPFGVSRRFRAMACVHTDAWPNEVSICLLTILPFETIVKLKFDSLNLIPGVNTFLVTTSITQTSTIA